MSLGTDFWEKENLALLQEEVNTSETDKTGMKGFKQPPVR